MPGQEGSSIRVLTCVYICVCVHHVWAVCNATGHCALTPSRTLSPAVQRWPDLHRSQDLFKRPLGFGKVDEEIVREPKPKELEWQNKSHVVRLATTMHSRICYGIVPLRRWGHTALVYRGAMYMFGGSVEIGQGGHREGESNDFHWLAFDTHEWNPVFVAKGKAPAARHGHTACQLGGRMIIFGGVGAKQKHYNDLHEFDFETQVSIPLC